jgi:biotin carboxyl carrier protein
MHYIATLDGDEHELEIEELSGGFYRVRLGPQEVQIELRKVGPGSYSLLANDRSFDLDVSRDGDQLVVASRGALSRVTIMDRTRRAALAAAARQLNGRAELKAMMPGRVVNVLVSPGDQVTTDQAVLVVEAMKMENELKAPKSGRVAQVNVEVGRTVEKGEVLLVIE